MNYRMYTDKDMNEEKMPLFEDNSMEDDLEMPFINGIHQHEMPMSENNSNQDMYEIYETMPWENNTPMHRNMQMEDIMPMYENNPLDDFKDMNERMPIGAEEAMYNMQNMMPCCMMNNMGAMPYMVELEEDEEDKKCDEDILDIVKKIEHHHPEILTVLSAYGIPYPVAIGIIKRIVRLSTKHK